MDTLEGPRKKMDGLVDFIGRVIASLSTQPDLASTVDLAYVERVRAERDTNLAKIAAQILGNGAVRPIGPLPGVCICTADHNATQLVWPTPEDHDRRRPCVRGDHCVACSIGGMGTPLAPLPEFLNPTQWAAYIKDGTIPDSNGRCLLCIRQDHQINFDIHHSGGAAALMVAPFTNLVDCIGGYRRDCTLSVYENGVSGGPVVRHFAGSEQKLVLEVDSAGRWRISEGRIRWMHPKC